MNLKKLIIGVFFSLSVISIGVLLFSFTKAIEPKENMKLLELIPKKTLDNIMDTYVEPISISPYNGGKPFCDYKIIDFKKDKNIIQIYLNL